MIVFALLPPSHPFLSVIKLSLFQPIGFLAFALCILSSIPLGREFPFFPFYPLSACALTLLCYKHVSVLQCTWHLPREELQEQQTWRQCRSNGSLTIKMHARSEQGCCKVEETTLSGKITMRPLCLQGQSYKTCLIDACNRSYPSTLCSDWKSNTLLLSRKNSRWKTQKWDAHQFLYNQGRVLIFLKPATKPQRNPIETLTLVDKDSLQKPPPATLWWKLKESAGLLEAKQAVGYSKSIWAVIEDSLLNIIQIASISTSRHPCYGNKWFYTLERQHLLISIGKLESSYVQRLDI